MKLLPTVLLSLTLLIGAVTAATEVAFGDGLQTTERARADSFSRCAYRTKRMAHPLVIGGKQKRVGFVRVKITRHHVTVSYKITRKTCVLTKGLHVEVTPKKLYNPSPKRFGCHRTLSPDSKARNLSFKCRASYFGHFDCCAMLSIYAYGEIACKDRVFSVYGGPKNNQCHRKNDGHWCRYMRVKPVCNRCACKPKTTIHPPTVHHPTTHHPTTHHPTTVLQTKYRPTTIYTTTHPVTKTRCLKMKKCNTPCDKSYRCEHEGCAVPKVCPHCKSYRPYVCPGEACTTPTKCLTCPFDKKEVCPNEKCVTPVPCQNCTSLVASSCPSQKLCKSPVACKLCPGIEKCSDEACPVPVTCPGCIDTKKCPNEDCPTASPCADSECGTFCTGETCPTLNACPVEGCGMTCGLNGSTADCPTPVACPGNCGSTCDKGDVCPSPESCM